MIVTVNGQEREVAAGAVLGDVLPDDCRGIAVALDRVVVPRAKHATTLLGPGARIEIVTAVQGG